MQLLITNISQNMEWDNGYIERALQDYCCFNNSLKDGLSHLPYSNYCSLSVFS